MPGVILNFHGIGPVPRALEPGEARFWIGHDLFRAILDAVAARQAAGAQVEITFDDGNLSDIAIGAPELAARGLAACFFPVAGRIGAPHFLGAADLCELAAAGHGVGSHGHDHVDWRRLDPAGRRREFELAPARIAAVTGRPADRVAVPYGFYNRRVLAELRRSGAQAVHTSDKGRVADGAWLRPRNCIGPEMSVADVQAILDGAMPPLRRLTRALGIARKRWQ